MAGEAIWPRQHGVRMPRARRQPQPGRRPDARRKQEGATQFPTIGLFERNAKNFKGTGNTKAQKSWSSRAEPEVRIHLPPGEESNANLMPTAFSQRARGSL